MKGFQGIWLIKVTRGTGVGLSLGETKKRMTVIHITAMTT
jgi:hypothetical protein